MDVIETRTPPRQRRTWFSPTVSDDLPQGQIVIVVAKWILVLAGMVLTLLAPAPIKELRIEILVLLLIAVENFYHHAQLLKRRPVPTAVASIASAADLAVVTILVMIQGGFDSGLYIFYFPALVALSLVFRLEVTTLMTGATVTIYGLICVADSFSGALTAQEGQMLLARVAVMIALPAAGAIFSHLEERRRLTGTAAPSPRPWPDEEMSEARQTQRIGHLAS